MRARSILSATSIVLALLGVVPAHATHSSHPVVLLAQGEELDVYTPGEATIDRGDAAALVKKSDWVNGTPCFIPGDPAGRFVEADDNPDVAIEGNAHFDGDAHPFWGIFNKDGSFTGKTVPNYGDGKGFDLDLTDPAGCIFQPGTNNLVVTDVGSNHTPTQGNGKLVEFFAATNYDTYCVLDPTISQAGFPAFATDGTGDLLVPRTGEGRIDRYSSLPSSAANCATTASAPWFIGAAQGVGTPIAITPDPRGGYAVSSVIAPSEIVHIYDLGPAAVVDGIIAAPGPTTGTPFGIAFAPNGDLYYADLGIDFFPECQQDPSDPTCLTDPIDSASGQSSLMIVHPGDNEIIPWQACSNCDAMDFADGIAVVSSDQIAG